MTLRPVFGAALCCLLPIFVCSCIYDRTGRSGTSMLVRDVQANKIAADVARREVNVERERLDVIDERAQAARQNIAQSNATAENLVESVQALAGELQGLRHNEQGLRAFDNDVDYRLADMEFRLMEIEDRLGIEPEPFLDENPEEPVDPEEPTSGTEGETTEDGSADTDGEDAADGSEPAAVDPPVALVEPDAESMDLLARATKAMENEEFKKAGQALNDFLDANPEAPQSADARAWLGDCLFEMGRYKEAISEYESFIQGYPDHARVPDAMLRQGLAFIELGADSDLEAARIFLDDLIARYPDSPEAERARKKVKILE